MNVDQKVVPVQRGVAVPCLVIFAATYVLGVFWGCFLLQREYQLELSTALGWALIIPLVIAPLWVLGSFLYNVVTVLLGIILFWGCEIILLRFCFQMKRKSLLVVALMVAAIWLIVIGYVAINLKDGF